MQIQGLCMSLLIEPFKKILHCHWLTFSTDSQREVFVNTALVYSVYLSEEFYYFYERFLPAISGNIFNNVYAVCDCGKRFGISTFSTTFVYGA